MLILSSVCCLLTKVLVEGTLAVVDFLQALPSNSKQVQFGNLQRCGIMGKARPYCWRLSTSIHH